MAYKAKFDIKEIEESLKRLEQGVLGAVSMGVYDGAAIVADNLRNAINSIRTSPQNNKDNRHEARWATEEEKAALQAAGVGIAKFHKDGFSVDTIIGHTTDYASIKGRNVPIPLLANAINSGTSFMHKQPIYRQAFAKSRQPVESAIHSKTIAELDKIK